MVMNNSILKLLAAVLQSNLPPCNSTPIGETKLGMLQSIPTEMEWNFPKKDLNLVKTEGKVQTEFYKKTAIISKTRIITEVVKEPVP